MKAVICKKPKSLAHDFFRILRRPRKARDRELYKAAGLLILAGLVDSKLGVPIIDRGELVGALLELAKAPADDPRRTEWKRAGDAVLAERSKKAKA